MTAAERSARTHQADHLCRQAYEAAFGGDQGGSAFLAVGGYGRGELAPHSDLDVVLVHLDHVDPTGAAERIWYPLWDSGTRLDHSVRSLAQMTEAAQADVRVALGLLDARHLAGDPNLTLRLRTQVLAQWRAQARARLPELRRLTEARHELVGELAHASVPDLKEAYGGLRDATVLKALVATWLVDVPHVELERSRRVLLDVRDELHALTGRPHDRIAGELWPDLAQRLGHPDALAAQRAVRLHGRRITHLSRLTWRRVDAALGRTVASSKRQRPGPSMTPIAPGVAVAGGEVVLEAKVRPGDDPTLLLRLAAVASERDLPLNPAAVARLVQEGTRLPDPWPDEARDQFVRLLAGPGLIAVWETLDETGAVDSFLPDWERIRLLPHASQIHRFTVDRHVVETCAEAARLIRQVARPDVLLVAALLHDIGKGELTEHCAAGEPIARRASTRMGFSAADVERIALLVRHHLLLADLATTRDPDDPATLAALAEAVPDVETLSLLAALTEADARATSPQAWSTWRASLIRKLAAQAAGHLVAPGMRSTATVSLQVPAAVRIDPAYVDLDLVAVPGGTRITVVAQDRLGLMADVAACLALQRTSVRAVRAWSQGDIAVSRWEVADDHLDARMLRQRIEALRAGTLDVRARLRDNSTVGLPPTVAVTSNASSDSTVLEVRAQDRPAVLFTVLDVLAQIGVSVRSAHVDTLGPQAVDVFYLQEESAGALSEERAVRAAAVVRRALGG